MLTSQGRCSDCKNSSINGRKIAHKKHCSQRPQKAQVHIWQDSEEFARWEKAHVQIAKENAMPFAKLKAKLFQESLKGFKYPPIVGAKYNNGEAEVSAYTQFGYNGAVLSQGFFAMVYHGTLADYWPTVLHTRAAILPTETSVESNVHIWQDLKEQARWERVNKQIDKEEKMPWRKFQDKLYQEALKFSVIRKPSVHCQVNEDDTVKISFDSPYGAGYEGKLRDYWTHALAS